MASPANSSLQIHPEPPLLEKWPDGSIRVAGSRLPFDRFVEAVRAGESIEELRETFYSQSPATIHRLMAYYLDHREEVDAWYEKLRARTDELRTWFEAQHPTTAWRERLRAVRAERSASNPE